MDLELIKNRLLKRRLIAAVIITVTVISIVFLSMRVIAQPVTSTCPESVSIYMKLSDIDGEVAFDDITGQTEVIRFSQGVYNPVTVDARITDTSTMMLSYYCGEISCFIQGLEEMCLWYHSVIDMATVEGKLA